MYGNGKVEGGLAVKRSRLSGAALAVAALVAAMVASAAYGITTAVQGQMDFKSCVSGTGGDGCTAVGNALGQPTAMGLSADESRLFVVSHGTDAVSAFVRDRGTGGLKPLKTNKIPCTTETGGGGTNCAHGHGLDGPIDVAARRQQRLHRQRRQRLARHADEGQPVGRVEGARQRPRQQPASTASPQPPADRRARPPQVPQTLVDPASVATAGSQRLRRRAGLDRRLQLRHEGRAQAAHQRHQQPGRVRHGRRFGRRLRRRRPSPAPS